MQASPLSRRGGMGWRERGIGPGSYGRPLGSKLEPPSPKVVAVPPFGYPFGSKLEPPAPQSRDIPASARSPSHAETSARSSLQTGPSAAGRPVPPAAAAGREERSRSAPARIAAAVRL